MLICPNLGISSYIQNAVNKNQNSKKPAFNKAQSMNLQPLKHDKVSFKGGLIPNSLLLKAKEEFTIQTLLIKQMKALSNEIIQITMEKHKQIEGLLSEVISSRDFRLNQAFNAFLQRVKMITTPDPFVLVKMPQAIGIGLQDHPLVKKMDLMIKAFTTQGNDISYKVITLLNKMPEDILTRESFSSWFKRIRLKELENINSYALHFQTANSSVDHDQRI